ncbi:hypothetical protein [Parabacteroides sp. Marseille-P3160]|uniref:hypothetical protein n=1 Tax=Parabacteroides sp. Marseille-P3160 TaxID=1917887 RepID=UPI0009BBC10C|nr:hypothetical protein [Parabacteroides sp. Marseille-P3160]
MARFNQNIDVLYAEKNKYTPAESYYRGALPYAAPEERSKLFLNLAKMHLATHRPDSLYIGKARTVSEGSGDPCFPAGLYNILSRIEESRKDYAQGLAYHKDYTRYLPSIRKKLSIPPGEISPTFWT